MVWNKDLAKLKQDLKAEEPAGPKRPVPKPSPKPSAPRELDEEDALFLAAMGGRRKPDQHGPEAAGEPPLPTPPAPEPADFVEAMTLLKVVKPAPSVPSRKEPAAPPEPKAETPPAETPAPAAEAPPQEAAPRWSPPLIQLAAGMAIDVDGSLDLRGHSEGDAVDRLKERLLDGHLLGWRTLHVHLGPSDELRKAFLEFLAGPEAALIARYAQAPIPMGGAQAWILYLGLQGQALH